MGALLLPCLCLAGPVLTHELTVSLPRYEGSAPSPKSVSVLPDGHGLCVTDAANMSAILLNDHVLPVFATDAAAGLVNPVDMCLDAQGGFACTDVRETGDRTIRRLNFYGESVAYEPERPDTLWEPERLVITRDGGIVTLDVNRALLCKHDGMTGALLWKRTIDESQDKELLAAGRPAEAPDGRLYLPLGTGRSVAVLTAEGELESSFGVPGTSLGRFAFPIGVAFLPDGIVAVLDRMRSTVLLFNGEHEFIAEFGEFGSKPANLYQPMAIAAGPDGRVYVVQGFQSRILVFQFSNQGSSWLPTDQSRPDQAGNAGTDRPLRKVGGGPRASLAVSRSHSCQTQPEIHPDPHIGGC